MSRIRDTWRSVEQQGSAQKGTPKGNGSGGTEVTPVAADAESILVAFTPNVASAQDYTRAEAELEQCPSGNWQPNTKTMLFFGPEEHGPGKEDFRALRSRLYQLREKIALKKILITSSVPKEGRSFVAANLAQVLARQQGCRVLLIDADLRSPGLHLALGTGVAPGLSEYLLGETGEVAIIQRGQMTNLFFIASGRPVSGQSEIVSNGRLTRLFARLAELFDWIIIDSPAALPVSDAGLIASCCDGVLMVIRSNSTPFDIVRKAQERFREDHILGIVLNGIPDAQLDNHYYNGASPTKSKQNGR